MKKILIANRGEIAIRVMRTAKKMGIKTVAVFSTVDRNAPHVKYADEAVLIGEAPSNQSYLLGDKIIEVAKRLNVDAIHPGYGFLSENADFAESCEKNNIIFIGPKSKAIKIMGSKLAAKDAVKAYNIPMVPGTDEAITDIPRAKEMAQSIGFPILIKASAGGGGGISAYDVWNYTLLSSATTAVKEEVPFQDTLYNFYSTTYPELFSGGKLTDIEGAKEKGIISEYDYIAVPGSDEDINKPRLQ